MEIIVISVIVYALLFWIGVKLKRWINGNSRIAKNQEKILRELQKQNKRTYICLQWIKLQRH